jgi:hypothetical protein
MSEENKEPKTVNCFYASWGTSGDGGQVVHAADVIELEKSLTAAEASRDEALKASDFQTVETIEGFIDLVPMGDEFDKDGFKLRPRFNCNFIREGGISTLHRLSSLLEHLSGQSVRILVQTPLTPTQPQEEKL